MMNEPVDLLLILFYNLIWGLIWERRSIIIDNHIEVGNEASYTNITKRGGFFLPFFDKN